MYFYTVPNPATLVAPVYVKSDSLNPSLDLTSVCIISEEPVVKPLTAFQGELDLTMFPPLGFILLLNSTRFACQAFVALTSERLGLLAKCL